jgi:hypothetical protein
VRDSVLRGSNRRLDFICALALILLGLGFAATPALAGRGVPIDNNTDEVWGDADNAQVVPLPFAVNYGAGAQTSVTVQLPSSFTSQPSGPAFAAVGLTFTNSPSDVLFAKVIGSSDPFQQVPAVRLSNETQTSTPMHPVGSASNFDFGVAYNLDMPPPADTSDCDISGISMACYGPMTDSAIFQFIDKSGSGNPGDFEVVLQCINECTNIGFNLGGLNFSADDFNPASAQPSQFISFTPVESNFPGAHGIWTFLFTNPSAVPEPASWALMLLGFGLIGVTSRRRRRFQPS